MVGFLVGFLVWLVVGLAAAGWRLGWRLVGGGVGGGVGGRVRRRGAVGRLGAGTNRTGYPCHQVDSGRLVQLYIGTNANHSPKVGEIMPSNVDVGTDRTATNTISMLNVVFRKVALATAAVRLCESVLVTDYGTSPVMTIRTRGLPVELSQFATVEEAIAGPSLSALPTCLQGCKRRLQTRPGARGSWRGWNRERGSRWRRRRTRRSPHVVLSVSWCRATSAENAIASANSDEVVV